MIEILWHGRGGQGAFTAAKLLGAAFSMKNDSSYALAFPSFGPERRGAPMRAFTKLEERPIGDRSEITHADYSIYLDDTLFSGEALRELKPGGTVLLNTKESFDDERIFAIDADALANEILGRPITNTVMLGALTARYDGVTVADLEAAIRLYMEPRLQEKNRAVVSAAAALAKGGQP